jgi:hypothetical protein
MPFLLMGHCIQKILLRQEVNIINISYLSGIGKIGSDLGRQKVKGVWSAECGI